MLSHSIVVIFRQLSLILIQRQKTHTQTHTNSIPTLLVQKFICKKWQMISGPSGPMFYFVTLPHLKQWDLKKRTWASSVEKRNYNGS